jgi:hypothetical protein
MGKVGAEDNDETDNGDVGGESGRAPLPTLTPSPLLLLFALS